jgi:hypothetical protein
LIDDSNEIAAGVVVRNDAINPAVYFRRCFDSDEPVAARTLLATSEARSTRE